MELKEVNNIQNPLMMLKASDSPASDTKGDFLSLLKGGGEKQSAKDVSRAPVNAQGKTEGGRSKKENAPVDDGNNVNVRSTDKKSAKKEVASEKSSPAEGSTIATEADAEDAVAAVVAPIAQEDVVVAPDVTELTVLPSNMMVVVENNLTGEKIQTTVDNLLQMLKDGKISLGDDFSIIPVQDENMPIIEESFLNNIKEALKKAASERATPEGVEKIAKDYNVISEQEDTLSKIVGQDTKLKVAVSTKEEKISPSSIHNLVKDAVVLNKVEDANTEMEVSSPLLKPEKPHEIVPQVVAPIATAEAPSIENTFKPEVSIQVVGAVNVDTSVSAARTAQVDNKLNTSDVYKGMEREVVEQVKVNITKSAVKGIDKIDIFLKPEELGKIEVKLQISKDGKLQAHIIASRPEVVETLQKDMQSLEKAFQDAGFKTDDSSLSFSFRDENANQNNENSLRNFIGNVLDKEDMNSQMIADSNYWDGKSALNIRV